jgi:exosome complex RNA-binding protein Rrp42 (RNase PH superfamily)
VFVDLVVLGDDVSLLSYRHLASLAAVSVLLYGFIRESD